MVARVSIEDAPRAFLIGMAKSLARTIDTGEKQNADGRDLRELLETVMKQIPDAPEVDLESGRRR